MTSHLFCHLVLYCSLATIHHGSLPEHCVCLDRHQGQPASSCSLGHNSLDDQRTGWMKDCREELSTVHLYGRGEVGDNVCLQQWDV